MRLIHIQILTIATICISALTTSHNMRAQGNPPVIAYMIPDIGTTRFATYAEIIGKYDKTNAFGTDGFYMNNPGDAVRVRCNRPADTNKVKIGPCVVSWNGRLISTHFFVSPTTIPNSDDWTKLNPEFRIPIEVVVNGVTANTDTFYIVKPFTFGDKRGVNETDLGSGMLGKRSRRGAMLIDSAILRDADYTININDSDPGTPGNQGFLPFVLMCIGEFSGNNTRIHASGNLSNGGPGGGGGGGAYSAFNFSGDRGTDGGTGYSGGGPGGYNAGSTRKKPGVGTGQDLPADINNIYGSQALSGVPGGNTMGLFENAGGGTGHPFGLSGTACNDYRTCAPEGAYGGGSGGKDNEKGGGGGYKTPGQSAFNTQNGGKTYGNDWLVPLAGGSGGASGNASALGTPIASAGGGGGGAVSIHARRLRSFDVFAYGDTPSKRDVLGGQGSGGGVILGSRLDNPLPSDAYNAQVGTRNSNQFSEGGEGRKRYDARINIPGLSVGLLSDTTTFSLRDFKLAGYGNGSEIGIYFKPENGQWQLGQTITNYMGVDWRANFTLPGPDTLFYIFITQKIDNPKTATYEQDPARFLSQSAWNIVRIFGPPIIDAPTASFMGEHKCPGDVLRDTVIVENKGASPLVISNTLWLGDPGFRLVAPTSFPDSIAAYNQKSYIVEYAPLPGQNGLQTGMLQLNNNDTIPGRDPFTIAFMVDVKLIDIRYRWSGTEADTLRIPPVCVGDPFPNFITVFNAGDTVVLDSAVSSDPSIVIQILQNLPDTLLSGTSARLDPISYRLGKALVAVLIYLDGCPVPDTVWMDFEGVEATITLVGSGQFGTVPVGTTRQVTLQIRNDGSSDLEIPVMPPGPNPPFRLVSVVPAPPVILETGEALSLVYEFAPTSAGPFTESFYVKSVRNGRSCEDSVLIILAGNGADVSVVAVPGSLAYASIPSCDSLVDSVRIVNNGDVDVRLLYPAYVNGPNAADFTIVSQPRIDTALPAGGSATYVITFRPLQGAPSLRTATLEIRTDASAVPQIEVKLSGTSISIAFNGPGLIDFGLVPVGVPITKTVSYTNMTGADVQITQTRSSRPAVLTATPNTFTLANTLTQDIDVTVTAAMEETTLDTLWFVSAQPCPDSLPVLVRWTSETGSLGVQNVLDFGPLSDCETKVDSLYVYNTGRTPVDLIDVSITGSDQTLFRILNPASVSGVTLDSGDFVVVQIEFDPRGATDGAKSADMVLRARIGNQPTPFVTQLLGSRYSSLPNTPNVVVFGSIDIQTTSSQIVTIVNNGPLLVHITSISLRGTAGGVFTVNPGNVQVTLQPKERIDITVTFTPLDQITYFDTVIVAFDLPCTGEKSFAVSGKGKLNVEVSIILPEMIIDPAADNLSLPVRARIATGSADSVTSTLKLTTRYQSQFFVAQSLSRGTIIRNTVNAGNTELEMEIPDVTVTKGEAELFTINGQGTLGSADSTEFVVMSAEFIGGNGSPAIRADNGWLKLNICKAGGPRLIQRSGTPLAIVLNPSPADDHVEVSVNVYERGSHSLELIDVTGVKVFEYVWEHQLGDLQQLINIDTKGIPAGLYKVRLSTPTRQRFTTAVIVH